MAERATLVETHCAVIVLVGDRAYKFKKPVDLGLLSKVLDDRSGATLH